MIIVHKTLGSSEVRLSVMPTIKLLNQLCPMLMSRRDAINEITQRMMETCIGLGLTDVHAEYAWPDGADISQCCAAASEPFARACCITGSLTAVYQVEFPPEAYCDLQRLGAFLSNCTQFCLRNGYTLARELCRISSAGSIIQFAVSIPSPHK